MVILLCAVFMFVDARTSPIIIWDESRLAVNALEMNLRGWSLVTTYGFAPDLWNTKPPLMIWLMDASIAMFGPSELSLRLPAMLASVGTLCVVFAFVRRVTHSVGTASLAVVLLAASAGFYGEHGARTADYDALLCFFTTAYLSVFYFTVHRRRPCRRHLIAGGALVAAATMTKTIAGILPGAGAALYMLLTGRIRRAFATRGYVLMMMAAVVPLTVFYIAREQIAPGYLHAVWYNDFAGRYRDQLGLDPRPWWFYLQALLQGAIFSAGALTIFAPLGVVGLRGQGRQALLYALCCAGAELVLISIPATRLIQYVLPALPWLAIACAIAISGQLQRLFRTHPGLRSTGSKLMLSSVLAAAAVIYIGVPSARIRYDMLQKRAFYPQASYGLLLASLHDHGARRVSVLESGINAGGLRSYAPQLRYYSLLWNTRGMSVGRVEHLGSTTNDGIVASCDPRFRAAMVSIGGSPVAADGCFATAAPALQPPTLASSGAGTAGGLGRTHRI
jgi:4-amino-4-deoxy-L-arabinose transferase-like glycosyltransferase